MPWVDAYDDTQNPIQIFVPDRGDDSQELWLQTDQPLYYMDRGTGEVKSGRGGKIGNSRFYFTFTEGAAKLEKSVIGKRLFMTEEEAKKRMWSEEGRQYDV